MNRVPLDLEGFTHVFFDFAGTLVRGVPCWEHPQVVACAECGRVVSPAEVKSAIWRVWGPLEGCAHPEASVDEASNAEWIGAIEGRILAGLDVPEPVRGAAVRRVMELQVAVGSHQIFPDVIPALEALRQRGLRLGLISNHAWGLPDLVAGLGLADYFDVIVTSARAGYRKPRPEVFQHALRSLDAPAERSLYIGDDPACDVVGAQRAGLAALLLDRAGREPRRDDRITQLTDLVIPSDVRS